MHRHLGEHEPDGAWRDFVHVVDRAYRQADDDRALLERSLELTSRELLERNEELRLAMSRARVGAWSWSVAEDETVWEGYPHPCFPGWSGRRVDVAGALADLVADEDRAKVVASLEAALADDHPVDLRIRMRGPTPRWIALRGGRDRCNCRVSGISFDVTAEVEREAERLALEASLFRAQQIESIGQLAGGIAHDFNNLLVPIMCEAELIGMELPTDSPIQEQLGAIQSAARDARELTGQLLAFGRQQVLELRTLDLNAELEQAARLLSRTLPESIAFELRLDPRLGLVHADARQLRQVLINLAINARDAMPDGGALTCTTRNDGSHVLIEVRDTGVGMDPETRARVFEPFFTTKALGRGTGLGLSMVYGIVRQHAGVIEIETAPGAGTAFVIRLPRVPDGEASPRRATTPLATTGVAATILLVEDEAEVRVVVRRMLERQGHHVVDTGDPREALAMFATRRASIDLLVTDVIMPTMTGRSLVERLTAAHGACNVLYMSGHARDVLGPHGVLEPRVALLRKPFTGAELSAAVQRALGDASVRTA